MSNPNQVDNAKSSMSYTPRAVAQIMTPQNCGEWLPIAVEIVTEADERMCEPEVPPIATV